MISDHLGRSFKKLRLSLTNECNYACIYCSDRKVDEAIGASEIQLLNRPLPMGDLMQIVKNLHSELNLNMVRLTGGEPLLHPKIGEVISQIKDLGIQNIGMTTNAHYLSGKVKMLKEAGLKSVNISLDALDASVFKTMSRYDGLSNVLNAIDEVMEEGLDVKINTVVLKGKNENQILPLLDFALHKSIVIRFLELMAMGPLHKTYGTLFYSESDIIKTISDYYNISKLPKEQSATAHYWSINGKKAFGVIANDSSPFCGDCNRLRLDSYGNIYGCLSSLKAIKVDKMSQGRFLEQQLQHALSHKQASHFEGNFKTMQSIGG